MKHFINKWDFTGNGYARGTCTCEWYTSLLPTSYAIRDFDRHLEETAGTEWYEEEE